MPSRLPVGPMSRTTRPRRRTWWAGLSSGAAVVDVDAVAGRPRHDQVVQFDVGDSERWSPVVPPSKTGGRSGSAAFKMMGLLGSPRSPRPASPPR